MKTILSIFLALFLTANLAIAQDTLYVYQGGAVLYKRAVTSVDSVSFQKVYATPISDIDGNVYTSVTIGTQTWMVENLKTSKYRDGSSIANVTDNTAWGALTTGAWCNYNNDAANGTKYGKLYNWYAVNDSRNIAPTGWHVATDDEWTTLETYVSTHYGTSLSTVKALAATTDWSTYSGANTIGNNLSINNYSGFSALPGGYRYGNGPFYYVGNSGSWWSSTEYGTSSAYGRTLYYNGSFVSMYSAVKSPGYSVRCVRDSN